MKTRTEAGFSLLESVFAIGILSVGALGMAGVFTSGMQKTMSAPSEVMATSKAAEAIESVFSARDSHLITWAQLKNDNDGGIFLHGPQPLTTDGADGVVGTADDGPVESIALPGPDQLLGTPDDKVQKLTTFTREIKIAGRAGAGPRGHQPALDHRHDHLQVGPDHALVFDFRAHLDVRVTRGNMHTKTSEAGFSLVELLMATAISLVVIATAMTTFKDAIAMNDTATNTADASQNMRGGVNFLVRDLVATGRGIPTGGIDIPTVAGGAGQIKRPSPPGLQYYFNNTTASTIMAVTTGERLGPTVDNQVTDIITLLTLDPILDDCRSGALRLNPFGTTGNVPVLAQDGGSFSVGTNVACQEVGATGTWIAGDRTQGQSAIKKGDLILFTNPIGQALQTVTRTDATNVYFEANTDDAFGLNQRNVTAGSITQILSTPDGNGQPVYQGMTAQRVFMYTYYVDSSVMGEPHLVRQMNNFTPQALAGIVEDLELSYDIVDGSVNPPDVKSLPYTLNGVTYAANQIRKVNVHIGVRSENMSTRLHDYLRNHLTTVVSLRSLAFVDRYSYEED